MTIFGRQPAFWIGVIVSAILAVLSVFTEAGVLNEALAGRITDGVNALAQILTILAPLIAALLIRTQVTPTAAPVLDQGTKVTVITPEGQPNTTKTL